MNQPDVVLFEKIACCSQSNKCVHSAPQLHNANNYINWDGPDDKMQMIQEIMQI
jgi:hypothetical protein